MIPLPVPERAEVARPWAKTALIGPPPGISREHCTDASVQVSGEHAEDGMGLTFRAYFKPTEAEIAKLSQDGYIEVFFRGHQLVPFGTNIF